MADKTNNTTEYVRPPIVTVMGHVDHGKTSILDKIRQTNVQAKEYGGITQHIGAYQIEHEGQKITFIDTPGHAAFTQMRARGGRAADIVILVVAADDGVQPQTKEAIAHARAGGAPIIVAINKIDLAGSDPQKAKQELAQENILVEDWGGDVVSVQVSAKTGEGLNDLLDSILAVAELLNLHADATSELEAIIIESKLDRQRGVVVSAIVRNGTLHVSDEVSASGHVAKIRSLMDDKGKMLKEVGPSTPVEILGFKENPNVGDLIVTKGSELEELAVAEDRVEIVGQETKKTIGIIIKADTQGTLEAVKASLANLVTESVGADFSMKFVLTSTGQVNDSDILLAQNTRSVVVGFNVNIPSSAETLAEDLSVSVKTYKTIYDLIDDIKDLLQGTAQSEEAKIKGRAEILRTFKLPSGDVVAGCNVLAGALKPENRIEIYAKNPADLTPDDAPIYRGRIKKLKHGKEDATIAGKNTECGVLFKPDFIEVDKGMFIEVR